MAHLVWGIVAILVGLVFCFRGYVALRAVISVWGAFVGFNVGALGVALATHEAPLAGPLGWVVALLAAVLFGGLAYAFYAAAVIVVMGSVGFALGGALVGLFDPPGWVGWLGGVAGATLLVLVALFTNLPEVLLILVAASGGASATVMGVALVTGAITLAEVIPDALANALSQSLWLNALYLVLFIAGAVTQLRLRSASNLRAAYSH